MSESSVSGARQIKLDYRKAIDDNDVSDACIENILSRLFLVEETDSDNSVVCVSGSPNSIITKDAEGCLIVPKAVSHKETLQLPKPAAIIGSDGRYIIPVSSTTWRITAVLLEGGVVVQVPNAGWTFEDPNYVYPASLEVFAANLDAETATLNWSVEGGQLIVESVGDVEILSALVGGTLEADPVSQVDAIEVEATVAGNGELTFTAAAVVEGIDYESVFSLDLEILPGGAFSKAYIDSISSDEVVAKFEGVTADLDVSLKVFTPATKESASEIS